MFDFTRMRFSFACEYGNYSTWNFKYSATDNEIALFMAYYTDENEIDETKEYELDRVRVILYNNGHSLIQLILRNEDGIIHQTLCEDDYKLVLSFLPVIERVSFERYKQYKKKLEKLHIFEY